MKQVLKKENTPFRVHFSQLVYVLIFLFLASGSGCDPTSTERDEGGIDNPESSVWYKGNLHTHSYWSNGNNYPEMIIEWYKDNGYHFLTMSEHNTIAESERWMDVWKGTPGESILQEYLNTFGEDWVDYVDRDSLYNVRLKRYDEYRPELEDPESFLLIQSEEIHDNYQGLPVHINVTNIQQEIEPRSGGSVPEILQNNIDAVLEQSRQTGRPMIPHINHPNIDWAISAEDIRQLEGVHFFELYSGHPNARNSGDTDHESTEEMWDAVNTYNLQNGRPLLYGLAVDDAQNYHSFTPEVPNPGRGWIQVRTTELSGDSLLAAMKRGDFYSSTGVHIKDIQFDGETLSLEITPESGVRYTTQFIGTLENNPGNPGVILDEQVGTAPVYTVAGDEQYIRARVISDKPKENAVEQNEVERAWIQPVGVLNP